MRRYKVTVYISEDTPIKAMQRVEWGFDETMSYEDKCKFNPQVVDADEVYEKKE